MKINKILTLAALATVATLATTLLFQPSVTLAGDNGRGDRDRRDHDQRINDPFVILLKGIYEPVVHAPNLGLHQVDLNDGSYSKTKIYSVSGLPGCRKEEAIGNFYVQFDGMLCAYQLPGGAMSMEFTGGDFVLEPDGQGGQFLIGTFELTILEGTGIYRSFAGGHNHMVDVLHYLADGRQDEYCFCNISRP